MYMYISNTLIVLSLNLAQGVHNIIINYPDIYTSDIVVYYPLIKLTLPSNIKPRFGKRLIELLPS